MKDKKREIICIACPLGCHLTVTGGTEQELVITGNSCPKGIEYGREEALSPKRVITATVAAEGHPHLRIPVKSSKPLLKDLIPSVLNRIYKMAIPLPVKVGDCILENIEETGVQLVVTKSIKKPEGQ